MTDADVLIVGAGPAGSSAASALARAGARVTLLDRARFPRSKPCSEYLSPEAARTLHALGVLDRVERAGAARLCGMIVRAPSGRRMRGDFVGEHGWRGFRDHGLAIRRYVLDEILVRRAQELGVDVREEVRVTDVVRDSRGRVVGVRAARAGGTTELRAELVIGADGLRSVVGRRLGLIRVAPRPRRIALVAHYRHVDGVGNHGEMHVEREGYVGLAPVDDGLTNVAVVLPATRAREAVGDATAFAEQWLARRRHLSPRFARAERVGRFFATGPFASRARRAWAPGAVLVGDAADFFDPFTGEGIYAALRGGELVASAAAAALGASEQMADHALAAYDEQRRREFGGKWTVERLVGLAVAWPPLLERVVSVLARRKDLADLLVGVTGDFVPAHEVLRLPYVLALLGFAPPIWRAA